MVGAQRLSQDAGEDAGPTGIRRDGGRHLRRRQSHQPIQSRPAQWADALEAGDRAELRTRIAAALAKLKSDPRVDPSKTAAIGYCFGGSTVLELARSGAEVNGVVSFHGHYDTEIRPNRAR